MIRRSPVHPSNSPNPSMPEQSTDQTRYRSDPMKKLINRPDDLVAEALQGMDAAYDALRIDHENRVVYRAEPTRSGKVGIVSGGGSGHEPLHAGFVGTGMLDAACAGEVFTSPVPDQVVAATQGVDADGGVLHLVKNYTGDVMNFEMAAELAAASDIRVASVVTDEDVAVQDSTRSEEHTSEL